jgi:hypothetical protein
MDPRLLELEKSLKRLNRTNKIIKMNLIIDLDETLICAN